MTRYVAEVIAGALLFALGMAFHEFIRPTAVIRVAIAYPDDAYREDDDGIQPSDPRLEEVR